MQENFWENKRVVLTGAGGFVGSHLYKHLVSWGATVMPLGRHSHGQHLIKEIDLTRRKEIEKIFIKFSPQFCFHLAGETLVESGQKYPYETFNNNIIASLNMLELCRKYRVGRIIVASTAHVYGNARSPLRENYSPMPSRPYETSKTCVELIAQSYADTYHLPVLIPRFVNIYGPGDLNFSRVIPKTIKEIISGRSPLMWGGEAKREYLYIDDAVKAYDLLARLSDRQIEQNRIFNFGLGETISVKNLIKMIISISGKKASIRKIHEGRTDEIFEQRVSSDKAGRILSWKPTVKLPDGLKKTYLWYEQHFRQDLACY